MTEVITLSKEEVNDSLIQAPDGFRFALVSDFHSEGVRLDDVKIYIWYQDKTVILEEAIFTKKTSSKWLQWMLDSKRVFIKTKERTGQQMPFTFHLTPTEEFLIKEIERVRR